MNIKKSISGKHWTDALSHSSLTDYSGEFDTALLMNNSCPENRELLGYLLFQRKIIWYSTNLKEVLLCFFTFWILVSVVCMFRHKTIYKFTNPVQRENYNKRLVWTNITELFSWLAGGYNTWLSTACFKIETLVRVFLYHCISDGNQLFSEHFECRFNFLFI